MYSFIFFSNWRPYDPSKHSRGNFVSRMVSICLGPNFNPSPAPTPERFLHFTIATHPPPQKKTWFWGGPIENFVHRAQIPSEGPDYMHFNLCWPTEDGLWNSINPVQSGLGEVDTAINMKRDYLPWWPSSHVKIERGRLILATPRSLQWANKEWKDENWRFILKCKLQGLSWLKIGLMILQPQHAQDYITLLPNHW